MAQDIGRVQAIALRTGSGGVMREVDESIAREGGGLDGDNDSSPARGLTLLSSVQWEQVCRELNAALPWHTRRANVLVSAAELGPLIGQTIMVGGVPVRIEGETRPCEYMDRLHPGLRAALVPACRGGVHGRVLAGGSVRVGDAVLSHV